MTLIVHDDIDWGELDLRNGNVRDGIDAGLRHLKDVCQDGRTPVGPRSDDYRGPRLVDAFQVESLGDTSGQLVNRTPYARKQEQRGWQRHTSGGPHFMETAFLESTDEVLQVVADHLLGGSTSGGSVSGSLGDTSRRIA